MSGAAIVAIHRSRYKANVVGLVVAVIILPVKFESGSVQRFEIVHEVFDIEPSLTNRNSASSVVGICRIAGVRAPSKNVPMPPVERVVGKAVTRSSLQANTSTADD